MTKFIFTVYRGMRRIKCTAQLWERKLTDQKIQTIRKVNICTTKTHCSVIAWLNLLYLLNQRAREHGPTFWPRYRFSGERPAYFSDSAHFRYDKILCWTNSLLFVNNEETLGENYEDWLSALWIAILTLLHAIYMKA